MKFRKTLSLIMSAALVFAFSASAASAAQTIRVALVVKALGIGFFDATHKGAEQAAKQLGNVKVIYTGPSDTTAEGQIAVINSLIAQHVNAIAISANDRNALVPILKRAMHRGITVVSWDSGVAPAGRDANLNDSNNRLIGKTLIDMAASAAGNKGEIAFLSTTPTATNQNTWIAEAKKALAKHPKLKLVTTVYGNDMSDKSYREAVQLMQSYPHLKVIIAPTTIGIAAAAQAVEDKGKVGKVFVTGLGLPSELNAHIKAGSVKSFALWNPINLGYAATMMAYDLATGKAKAKPGEKISLGDLGTRTLNAQRSTVLGAPTVFDAGNIAKFAKLF